jgi:hypothetical protein
MKIAQVTTALCLGLGMAGFGIAGTSCGDDDGSIVCGDGGCADAGTTADAGVPYVPTAGRYKVISYNAVSDGCMIDLGSLTNSTNPDDWIAVRVEGNTIKIGNDRGTPAQASLGQGPLVGVANDLARSNHVKNPDPSPCEYDSKVTSRVTLDDVTGRTIGLSVREEQTNRTMCTVPVDVGPSCTSTWSWRLTPAGL